MIIVIGRQYGSGGRKVAKMVSRMLGIPYYDKELLGEACRRLGYCEKIFNDADERRPSPLRTFLGSLYGVTDSLGRSPMSRESIYKAQSDVIRKLASEGDMVIVGRTADYLLRDRDDLLSVFIHSPIEQRAKNIMERGETSDLKSAEDKAHRIDSARESYYNYFTGRKWGTASTYHMSIDSTIGMEEIAEIIIQTAKAKIASRGK